MLEGAQYHVRYLTLTSDQLKTAQVASNLLTQAQSANRGVQICQMQVKTSGYYNEIRTAAYRCLIIKVLLSCLYFTQM